jgi:hypothetical protein
MTRRGDIELEDIGEGHEHAYVIPLCEGAKIGWYACPCGAVKTVEEALGATELHPGRRLSAVPQ